MNKLLEFLIYRDVYMFELIIIYILLKLNFFKINNILSGDEAGPWSLVGHRSAGDAVLVQSGESTAEDPAEEGRRWGEWKEVVVAAKRGVNGWFDRIGSHLFRLLKRIKNVWYADLK